jgi:RNA polymerase sigma-70 factor, ECF subfamily
MMSDTESEFQEIHDTYRPKIFRYLSRLVGEHEAEDITQEVFIRVNQALGTFRGESKLSTWLYRIATNAATDRLRSPSFQRDIQEKISSDLIGNDQVKIADKNLWTGEKKHLIEQNLVRIEMNRCIRDFIENLPEIYRTVLVLGELEGLENKEIAEILGVTLGMVKIRIHRAREKLRKELEQHCDSNWIVENEFIPDFKEVLGEFQKADPL